MNIGLNLDFSHYYIQRSGIEDDPPSGNSRLGRRWACPPLEAGKPTSYPRETCGKKRLVIAREA
jgi:hypothetical protein